MVAATNERADMIVNDLEQYLANIFALTDQAIAACKLIVLTQWL